MRRILIPALTTLVGIGLPLSAPLLGQMHKVAAPDEVVRAVGVYEWTGDRAKPTASRLIPVTIFINGKLEDAGEYLARPVPLALDSGTVYEVDRAGVPQGLLDLQYASHLNASGSGATDNVTNFDDGWFGYGTFTNPPAPKKTVALKESKRPAQIESSKPDTAKTSGDRPTFSRRPDAAPTEDKTQPDTTAQTPGTGTPAKPGDSTAKAGDSTTKAGDASSTKTDKSASTSDSKNDDDPDRPHLIRKPDATTQDSGTPSGTTQTTGTGTSTGTVPADDPDRPTLKKRSPEEAKKAKREASESSASGLATSLNDDPNRPTLHRGKGQQAITEAEFPKLKGVPSNLNQAVAVSDAKTRPVHDFSRPWEDDTEKATILAKMQEMARTQIATYRSKAATTPAPAPKAAPAKPTPNSKLRRPKSPAPPPPPEPLLDEELKGYTLSYGGAATYVYTARTDGEGTTLIYATVVAQMDALGTLQSVIQSVTDAAHLDRTPWMRLVDVVDAEASNRASLLFELREKDSRQFALYRVIAARSEQTFLTGTTQ
jgi:hypothetical protein